ncbi:MAG TPA: hypothetical protein VK493_17635 [Bryobacteraceae bacterium]|nr:hypothetical protein [Bryobacteraceae bacterium]
MKIATIGHLAAEFAGGLKRRLLFVDLRHYGGGEQCAFAEVDTAAAIPQVEP